MISWPQEKHCSIKPQLYCKLLELPTLTSVWANDLKLNICNITFKGGDNLQSTI